MVKKQVCIQKTFCIFSITTIPFLLYVFTTLIILQYISFTLYLRNPPDIFWQFLHFLRSISLILFCCLPSDRISSYIFSCTVVSSSIKNVPYKICFFLSSFTPHRKAGISDAHSVPAASSGNAADGHCIHHALYHNGIILFHGHVPMCLYKM